MNRSSITHGFSHTLSSCIHDTDIFTFSAKKVILFDQCRRLKNDYNCLTKVFIPEIPQGLKNVKFPNGNCFPHHLESKVQRTLSSTMRSFKETNTYDFTDFTY